MRDMSTRYGVGRFEGPVDERIGRMRRCGLRAPRLWAVAERDRYAVAAREEVDAE